MELDDLDDSKRAPSRVHRFAPKGSKIKPKTEPAVLSTEFPKSEESDKKKEELEPKTSLPLNLVTAAKAEIEVPTSNDVVSMDVNASAEEPPKGEDMKLNQNGEDEVVREIDVYFNTSLDSDTKLYVFQYPLRPLWRPYEFGEVRVKPGCSEVEIDVPLDVDSINYDRDADPEVLIEKMILTSTTITARPGIAYAVGVLEGNQLHLNPVETIVQLRPSIQKSRSARKKMRVMKEEDIKGKKPNVSAKKQNESSASNEQMKDTGEEWITLKHLGQGSDASERYLRRMVEHEDSPIQFTMSREDYLNAVHPTRLRRLNDSNGSNYPSRRFLLSLPLEERFKTLFLQGPPIHRFDALKSFAPEISDEDTLGVICRHARLVQGLWVPKSSLLHGQGIEVLAREFVLLHFSKRLTIKESAFPRHDQMRKAIRNVLSTLARYRDIFSDWKFNEVPDQSFIKLHPNLVRKEEQGWAGREKNIMDSIFRGRDKPTTANDPGTLKSSIKQTSKSSNGGQSRMPMSDETRQALPKILNKIFKDHKVCSFQQICQRLREMAVSKTSHPKGDAKEVLAAAKGVDAPIEELQDVIGQVAINIHGVYVPKSSPDHPECDAFRKVVIDLFLAEGPNAKLKKASIVEAAKLQLKLDDIAQAVYQKVLSEICVSTKGSCWVLKNGDGNLR